MIFGWEVSDAEGSLTILYTYNLHKYAFASNVKLKFKMWIIKDQTNNRKFKPEFFISSLLISLSILTDTYLTLKQIVVNKNTFEGIYFLEIIKKSFHLNVCYGV